MSSDVDSFLSAADDDDDDDYIRNSDEISQPLAVSTPHPCPPRRSSPPIDYLVAIGHVPSRSASETDERPNTIDDAGLLELLPTRKVIWSSGPPPRRESLTISSSPPVTTDMWGKAQLLVAAGRVQIRRDRTEQFGGQTGDDFSARVHCFRVATNRIMNDPSKRSILRDSFVEIISRTILKGGGDPVPFAKAIQNFELFIEASHRADGLVKIKQELVNKGIVEPTFYDTVCSHGSF